ncbi:MAG TPA: LuxR C-terminal-related transcriptional regulator [Candidatus Sulfotelmatobacter sp.]|nr:LuxR C-terminal-related transcriptional regulator [Candidatus Sulfotelmatobacter sp.]
MASGPFAGLLARRFGDVPFADRVRDHGHAPSVELLLARRATGASPALAPSAKAPVEPLTAREHEILTLLATGLSNGEIAQRLIISPRTVETHVARVTGKLGVNSRARAVARAIALGIIAVQ